MSFPLKQFKLSNGLPVLVYEMESVMSCLLELYVRVGSVYEKGRERGLSHLTEHLSLISTTKFKSPLIISRRAQSLGASFDGSTSRFATDFWVSLPSKNVKQVLDLLHQLVFEPLLKEADIEGEKKVILSEYNEFWQSPENKFNYESLRVRFKQKEHPYVRRALGTPETVASMTKKDIVFWRKKYYQPANMFLVITGNVKEKEIRKTLENSFADIDPGTRAKEPVFKSSDYSDFTVFVQKEKGAKQVTFVVSYPTFGSREIKREKRIGLYLANFILGQGPSSRLFQRLREKEKLVYRISSHLTLLPWLGDLAVIGSVSADNLLITMKLIKEEIEKMKEKGITDKELRLARQYLEAKDLMRFDSPSSINSYFVSQLFIDEKIWFPDDYAKEAKKITSKEINNLIFQVFSDSRINISLRGDISSKTKALLKQIYKN